MKLGIIGAGGHGKVVGDIALSLNYNQIFYFDDINKSKEIKFLGDYAGKINKINEYKAIPFIVAIGDNNKRKKIFFEFIKKEYKIISLIHPSSFVSKYAKIGKGSVVMPKTVINASTKISNSCIINTSSSIDHDNQFKDFSSTGPGVKTGGNVSLGERSHIGIGSSVKQGVKIYEDCIIGANSYVNKNCEKKSLYFGSPIKKIKIRNKFENYL